MEDNTVKFDDFCNSDKQILFNVIREMVDLQAGLKGIYPTPEITDGELEDFYKQKDDDYAIFGGAPQVVTDAKKEKKYGINFEGNKVILKVR
jgi:hypothetical protein